MTEPQAPRDLLFPAHPGQLLDRPIPGVVAEQVSDGVGELGDLAVESVDAHDQRLEPLAVGGVEAGIGLAQVGEQLAAADPPNRSVIGTARPCLASTAWA